METAVKKLSQLRMTKILPVAVTAVMGVVEREVVVTVTN